ncbi:ABC transporter G family member 16 [Tetranychus urticae]|uniref:ABC transporter G family member 16 n=1 Tax=Tetranychus urticae TaxID=32264 RepID=UPI00077BF107|nr:ABC transporter G family member 16 [Tetranychus urticae]XP_015787621.1 ABC transporter G family member 16 [Tetranychus urticae]
MWDDRESRKYVAPNGNNNNKDSPMNSPSVMSQWPGGGYGNRGYDNTEDLHAWSIYRQNLNADLSESAIGINKSVNGERPFGNFQLKETTVKNILNHPKYGPRLRNHDPATYLRYGLPRVKVSQSELGVRDEDRRSGLMVGAGGSSIIGGGHIERSKLASQQHKYQGKHGSHLGKPGYGHHLPSDSASMTDVDDDEEEDEIDNGRSGTGQPVHAPSISSSKHVSSQQGRKNVGRTWKSDPDLLRGDLEESIISPSAVHQSHHHPHLANHSSSHLNSHLHSNQLYRGKRSQANLLLSSSSANSPSNNKYSGLIHSSPPYMTANGKAVSETDLRFPSSNHNNKNNNNYHTRDQMANGNGYGLNGKMGKTNGYIHSNGEDMIDTELPLSNGLSAPSSSPKNPHLIVRGLYYELDKTSTLRRICGAQRTKSRILDNISFEVKAGEVLAIMATSEYEGTSILEILSDRYNKSRGTVKSEITLNGIFMTPAKLSQVSSYVGQDTDLCPNMSARQTLLFSSLVQGPAKKNTFDTKKRTNAVLEELGLSEVRHTSVADLTEAEKRRLLIGQALLLDTDLLLLDQPTKGMDIFDSFFLIEYLRQWALISGRCVILTIQPATYEIFTMLSQIALVSTGRILYFGKRKDLLTYFSYIDFPCPTYKNPSDYYLDLVTLDNLSSEAMLESSQRIENLVDLYSNRCSNAVSLPGPPSVAPPPVRRAHMTIMFLALWIRALIFTFPYNVIHLFRNLLLAISLSICTGIIYWHIRIGREQEHLWDRIGLYHTILTIMPIPLFLVEIHDAHKEKNYVLNEVKMQLYTKPLYVFSKILYTLPKATLVFMGFIIPVSSMAGLQNNLLLYLVILLGYLHMIRMIALSMAWSFDRRSTASLAFGLIFSILTLAAGTTFHYKDLSVITKWLHSISPIRYTHEVLIGWEFHNNYTTGSSSIVPLAYQCTHNPIIQQENAILIKADCGFQQREHILRWFNYKTSGSDILRLISQPFIAYAIVFAIFLIIGSLSFCFIANKKNRRNRDSPTSS